MKKLEARLEKHIDLLIYRFPKLDVIRENIVEAYLILEECYMHDGKLLIAGNGGSAADSEHMAGELMKSFKLPRPISKSLRENLKKIDSVRGMRLGERLERSLMAIPLVAHEAFTTAYINDVDAQSVFAQQLLGFGRSGDVLLGISTSGSSENIINAAIVAKASNIKIIGLTGYDGGILADFADVTIKVPEKETYMVQELHLPIYHCLCLMLEDKFFGNDNKKEMV